MDEQSIGSDDYFTVFTPFLPVAFMVRFSAKYSLIVGVSLQKVSNVILS